MLTNIKFILSHTAHPGNIGASARAMKTMGLSHLSLVAPTNFSATQGDAFAMAAGADDILAQAEVSQSLTDAVADCRLLIGTSARDRSLKWPMLTPKQCAEMLVTEARKHKVAVLFGRERIGLQNDELQKCHYHVQIPANPEYSSLNLAQAVQVIAYEIFDYHHQTNFNDVSEAVNPAANLQEMEHFYQHLDQLLHQAQFISDEHPNRIMPRLRRLFNRARPDSVEINILRGMFTEIMKRLP